MGWTEYHKCHSNLFILCEYIAHVYTYLHMYSKLSPTFLWVSKFHVKLGVVVKISNSLQIGDFSIFGPTSSLFIFTPTWEAFFCKKYKFIWCCTLPIVPSILLSLVDFSQYLIVPGTLQYHFGYSKSLKASEKREFDDDDEDHDEADFFLKLKIARRLQMILLWGMGCDVCP